MECSEWTKPHHKMESLKDKSREHNHILNTSILPTFGIKAASTANYSLVNLCPARANSGENSVLEQAT